jgi:hypothetical protein
MGGNIIEIRGSNFKPFNWETDVDNRNETFCYFTALEMAMPMTVTSATGAYC